jgi:hypothetical protein
LIERAQPIAQRRPGRRAGGVVIQRDEERIEPRLPAGQLVADRRQVLGRDQEMTVIPDEPIPGGAVGANLDERAGGKR